MSVLLNCLTIPYYISFGTTDNEHSMSYADNDHSVYMQLAENGNWLDDKPYQHRNNSSAERNPSRSSRNNGTPMKTPVKAIFSSPRPRTPKEVREDDIASSLLLSIQSGQA